MKITIYEGKKLTSSFEWDESSKTLVHTIFKSTGEVDIKRVVEGCETFVEAKEFLQS